MSSGYAPSLPDTGSGSGGMPASSSLSSSSQRTQARDGHTPVITDWDGVMAELFEFDTVYMMESGHDSSSGIASDDHNGINSSPPSTSSVNDSPSQSKSSRDFRLGPHAQRRFLFPDIDDDDFDDEDDIDDGYGCIRGGIPRGGYPQFSSDSGDCRSISGSGDYPAGEYQNVKLSSFQPRTRCHTPNTELDGGHPPPQNRALNKKTAHHESVYNNRNLYPTKETYTTQEMHIQDTGKVMCEVKRKNKVDYFELLPDDVITKIFSRLPSDQLCRNSRVCRRWYNLVWDPLLWTTIRINNPDVEVDRALKVLTRRLSWDTPTVCVMVERINLNGCEMLTDRGLHVIAKRCPELRHLELQGCPNISNIALFEVVSRCVNLEHLNVTGCPCITCICLTPEATVQATAYGKQIYLRFLDMTDCFNLDDSGLQIIASYCSQLVYLYLRRCFKVTDIGVQYVANYCANMKEFSISDCHKVTDFGLRELSKLGSNLRYLSVAKCDKISDVGVRYIAQYCHKIRYLNVRGCEAVSDDSVEMLAHNCRRLKSLDIGKCDVTDEGLMDLADSSPQLRRLSLKACEGITDKGVISLAFKCRQLQQLNIQECHLSVEAYRAVKKYCKRCIIEHTNPGFY